MARVRIKGLKRVRDNTIKNIEKALDSRSVQKDVADFAIKDIVGNARLGKDPNNRNFKSLARSTKEQREYLSRYNSTDSFFSVNKSNLTVSGQLLNSIKAFFKKREITIEPTGTRRKYRGAKGQAIGQSLTNKEVADFVQEDRPFLLVSKALEEFIKNRVRRELRRILRKSL